MRNLVAVAVMFVVGCSPALREDNGGGDDDDGKGDAICEPGATRACYDGAAGTEGVGPCRGGTQTCSPDGVWLACTDQVIPTGENCTNGIDDNCNGAIDEETDNDGDGFSTCGGDCCDSQADGCGSPELVNPGAFEASGNSVDDDCDGIVDNAIAATCDTGLASNSATALDYAKAIDLCQTATMTDGRWGVISARFVHPSGTGTPNAAQRAIRPAFGSTSVQAGASFAVLSTGNAAAPGQTNPGYVPFQGGNDLPGASAFPSDWLAANGGSLPNAPGCPAPQGTQAQDPIMLELTVRAPTNAKSFSLATNFLSSEYPEWTCSPYNDFFVVLLDSAWNGQPANPTDKNLATYTSAAMMKYPVGVNLAHGNTGLFTVCKNGQTGCADGSVAGNINTCMATTELAGTGMDGLNPSPQYANDLGYCGANNQVGGGTGWLTTQGNIVGGEVFKLRIAIWDTSDGFYDSVSLIDNFQWSVDAAQPGTVIF